MEKIDVMELFDRLNEGEGSPFKDGQGILAVAIDQPVSKEPPDTKMLFAGHGVDAAAFAAALCVIVTETAKCIEVDQKFIFNILENAFAIRGMRDALEKVVAGNE